jgi:opacity protein-like surface antigen
MKWLLAPALCALLPVAAIAQPAAGPYLSGSIGLNIAGSTATGSGNSVIDTNPGPIVLGAAGWRFGNGLRAELEGSFRSNGVSEIDTRRINGRLEPVSGTSGAMRTYAVMANVLYDIPVSPFHLPIQPYIGAGVGYAWLGLGSLSGTEPFIFHLPQNNTYSGPAQLSFSAQGAFAAQAIAGLSAPLPIPGLIATFEYRFFATTDIGTSRTAISASGNVVNGAVPAAISHSNLALQQHAILVGLRYSF